MSDVLELGAQRAKELGMIAENNPWLGTCYKADDIHKLLGEGGVVGRYSVSGTKTDWASYRIENGDEMALVVGIRPNVKESEERKLLREFVDYWVNGKATIISTLERAKALLSENEK